MEDINICQELVKRKNTGLYEPCGKKKVTCSNYCSIHKNRKKEKPNIINTKLQINFENKLNLNDKKIENINYNEDINYPFTMPIMCFSCNTVISRIDIFNKLWNIYINNINNKKEYINKLLEDKKINKNKWEKDKKKRWWQKIGGFEEIRDGIEIKFTINDKEWKNIGIENLCCRRMIYTHEENPLFVYGISDK
jgi:DNA-directed RNA polymerase subunit N (RpoN/RPB10)